MTPVNAHALARPGSETGFVKQRSPQHVLPISILADISILVKRTQDSMDCAFVQIELIADLSQRQGRICHRKAVQYVDRTLNRLDLTFRSLCILFRNIFRFIQWQNTSSCQIEFDIIKSKLTIIVILSFLCYIVNTVTKVQLFRPNNQNIHIDQPKKEKKAW